MGPPLRSVGSPLTQALCRASVHQPGPPSLSHYDTEDFYSPAQLCPLLSYVQPFQKARSEHHTHRSLGHVIHSHQSGLGVPKMSPESWVSLARSMPFISYIGGVSFTGHLLCCVCSLFCSPPYRTRALTSPLDSFILGDCPTSWLELCFSGRLLGIDCHCQVCLAAAPRSILDSLDSAHGPGQVPVIQPL